MVQSIIDIDENEDRILNIVKAKFGFKNKSQAVAMIARIYGESFLEPELRPEYLERLMKISQGKHIPFKDINDLRRQTRG
ncbi:MAG: DUF2683 family protein [Candidatus Pacearchaeota archaeon]|nr:DUF2683 family protein [Candidatus Pacearchaeota archaeon]MDE1848835.1 DUF2683 family protein [Nanoarchaeota archaeon]